MFEIVAMKKLCELVDASTGFEKSLTRDEAEEETLTVSLFFQM